MKVLEVFAMQQIVNSIQATNCNVCDVWIVCGYNLTQSATLVVIRSRSDSSDSNVDYDYF